MEPTTLIDDAEFWLPPEFLTDDDFLVEKKNTGGGIDESNNCLFPDETRHGFGSFGLNSGFSSTVKPISDEDNFLAGLTRQMVQSTLEDEFSGGFFGNHAFPAGNDNKAWGTRSPQSTLFAGGIGCGCRNQRSNQNCQSRVSSQAAWDLYCAAAEEVANESYDFNSHGGRGLLGPPRKLSSVAAAVKNPNNGSGYYSHHSLPYQKLQAIQFQQLKQQQLMKHHRQLVQQSRGVGRVNCNTSGGPVDLSSSAWSNQQPRREGSGMRAVFLGDNAGKRGSTGTGVFLPRRVNHTSPATAETRKKPALATVLVPARVAQVLNLNLDEPVRSSASFNGITKVSNNPPSGVILSLIECQFDNQLVKSADASWKQRSNNNGGFSSQMHGGVRTEQTVNDPRLPSDWAY